MASASNIMPNFAYTKLAPSRTSSNVTDTNFVRSAPSEQPGASDFSVKSLANVIADARAALDEGYGRLGKKADTSTNVHEWDDIVGLKNFDRRTLNAIADNQGGLFSADEISAAKSNLTVRHSQAIFATDPTGQNVAAIFKASIAYLDAGGPEEKATFGWAEARASSQRGYELRMQNEGREPDNVNSGNYIVDLLLNAYGEASKSNDINPDIREMPSYLKARELWQRDASGQISWNV